MLAERMKVEDEELKVPEQERRKKPLPPANMKAPFPSPPYIQRFMGMMLLGSRGGGVRRTWGTKPHVQRKR
jgi:hypothetical protein